MYKPYSWGDNKKHFIYVGDDCKYRNGAVLIEAMSILKNDSPEIVEQIKIHIMSTPKRAPVIHNLIQQKNLDSYFVFEGVIKREELFVRYKSADGLLFPSSVETIGLPILEAATFGLPVLVADVDYAHDVIKKYEGAIYISTYDYGAWAEAIKLLLHRKKIYSPLLRKQLSEWRIFRDLLS